MIRLVTIPVLAGVLFVTAFAGGCALPVLERTQHLQLAAMVQYRDEMAAYHAKVKAYVTAEKLAHLDSALTSSLAQAADEHGRVPLETVMEKVRKRAALEEAFRGNLARLDAGFARRQEAIGRAIELAGRALDLLADYGRLGTLVRSLFVREAEARQLVRTYESERSANDAGIGSELETGGG